MRTSFDRTPQRGSRSTHIRNQLAALLVIAAGSAVLASPASAAAPEPCNGVVQITDTNGDGHHATTDVLSAWLSESAGSLQAVIQVKAGNWAPDHEDSDEAGFAFLYRIGSGSTIHYVRVVTPRPADGAPAYDQGTWTQAGGFASAGATTGVLAAGTNGTATLDIPAATLGLTGGSVITAPFVLTYDGADSPAQPHWVDRAPGGTSPSTTEVGADYVVGCESEPGEITAVELSAPASRRGAGPVAVSGSVVPAIEGAEVDLVIATAKGTSHREVTTTDDGSFSDQVPLTETAEIHAVAGGLSSQTKTVTMRSLVTLKLRAKRNGRVAISGTVDPRLRGKVLILGAGAFKPSAKERIADGQGRFAIGLARLAPGRYQAVYVPAAGRAERSVSRSISHKPGN